MSVRIVKVPERLDVALNVESKDFCKLIQGNDGLSKRGLYISSGLDAGNSSGRIPSLDKSTILYRRQQLLFTLLVSE